MTRALIVTLVAIVLARFALLNQYPLIGTTEPRYAELARKMLVSGDWVTLWVADGVPLWGKPPLLFWLDAISMSVLGVTEFALRLPTFLASLCVMWLLWFWPAPHSHQAVGAATDALNTDHQKRLLALLASVIYISTPFGFFAAGFVATDIFLAGSLSLSMVSFWIAVCGTNEPASKRWRWGFFIGMALGLLAKGPLALVLLGVALFLWAILAPKERFLLMWQKLPWARGLILMSLIALPWYILAEIRTPGFLYHFIIGEHIERFLVKDWAGGRFAASHGEPLGMIWWFAVEAFFPWLLLVIPALRTRWRERLSEQTQYLLCWVAAPLLFFSLSHNILEAYVLPALPAFALLMSGVVMQLIARHALWRFSLCLALLIPLVVVVAVVFFNPVLDQQSQKHLLKHWHPPAPLVYVGKVPPSAVFYANNQAVEVANLEALQTMLGPPPPSREQLMTAVMHQTVFDAMTSAQKINWQLVEQYGEYVMMRQAATISREP